MRFWNRAGWLTVLALALSACGAAAAEAEAPATAATQAPTSGSDAELTETARLMLGTMKLDEVGLQPDATEAGQLLTLWQAYRAVITSDTAAPAEAEAVLRQIRTTMTSQQVEAIAAMDLTQDDLGAFMEEARQSASQGSGDTFEGFRPGQGPDGGPGPGFAPPSGGGFGGEFGGGGGFSPEQRATGEAAGQTRGADSGRADLFLLRPLIAALTTLAGS